MTIGSYKIHARDAKPVPAELSVENFPYETLMGDWMIVGSSLPLWKARSDVLCRYTPHDIPSSNTQARFRSASGGEGQVEQKAKQAAQRSVAANVSFSDEIWWEQLDKKTEKHLPGKGAPREKRSIVRGRNKIDPKGVNGATYLWRGYNFLKPFTSHWQIVAHNDRFTQSVSQASTINENDDQDGTPAQSNGTDSEPIWLVTYFTATMFTEAGIDLYVRGTLTDEAYNEIVEALKNFQGDTPAAKELRDLASKMFKVPVGNI
ncbi:uncharacterized protein FA14DRAFT_4476 [Meira miltonrushii]|uniref:Uncharacterized protein n=1 Tax=Meira miltonrushii TaxID=1280837 RepID=A0A316VJW5_9BASI|nr:uncharacterized protein FA14DRAFT_4476 [Meira miltonrushii]PWN36593.1 hypothetical protein FA14DRAFT_4476 [Meira miltonrushii]